MKPASRAATTLSVLIAGAVVALYARTARFGYVFDDRFFIVGNGRLADGVTWEGLRWALSGVSAANWHPVTWISHMVDRTFFGSSPGPSHLVNAGLHAVCASLLFFVMRRMTGALLPSAFVAAAFALHPLRVESVAWVTERKDALSTIFSIMAMGVYTHYARRPRALLYVAVAVLFALGLMTKAMLVTFPFALLLLDWWPLGRLRPGSAGSVSVRRLILEKVPLLLLAGGTAGITIFGQAAFGAVQSLATVSAESRLTNAIVAYATYLIDTVWPVNLAVYYPHPGSSLPLWRLAGASLLLASLSILAVRTARRYPALLVGWLWYLGTLVPVIGFVQIGGQGHADRYTYLPSIGLAVAFTWGMKRILARFHPYPALPASTALAVLAVLAALSWRQIGYWRDDVTLFTRALAVTKGNNIAENNLGFALEERGDLAAAMSHYRKALSIRPDYEEAHFNLGSSLEKSGRMDEARLEYLAALRIEPGNAEAHYRLGVILAGQGRHAEAIGHYRLALLIRPDIALLQMNLANVLSVAGESDEALTHYAEALRLAPMEARIYANRGVTLAWMGRKEAASSDFREALRLDSRNETARRGLRSLFAGANVEDPPARPK